MESAISCSNHPSEPSTHTCARCSSAFCIDCLTIVNNQAVCRKCARSPRSFRDWMVVVYILATSLGIGLIMLIRMLARLARFHH